MVVLSTEAIRRRTFPDVRRVHTSAIGLDMNLTRTGVLLPPCSGVADSLKPHVEAGAPDEVMSAHSIRYTYTFILYSLPWFARCAECPEYLL